ncbi:MAG: cytochrome c oxidase assembly protein [Xanthobacteraceae bacterium]
MDSRKKSNLRVIAPCLVAIGIMLGLVAYSPTLYRVFCGATGLGGTTQRVNEDTAAIAKRVVTVQFDSNVEPSLPWRFVPEQRAVKVHLGEQKLVYFSAENTSDQPIVGHATFNVTPLQTGAYFDKIQCFCFTEERLDPHQKIDMPVVFFVDPAFGKDPELRDIDTITLAYTFFRSADPANARDLSRFLPGAPPDPAHGEKLFTERCTACHALEANKFGPMLGGVVGRKAGSLAGYPYSPALKSADLTWTADNLDHWLAGPQQFVPGVKMPIRVLEATSRRDIIAYLQQESEQASKAKTSGSGS